MAGRLSIEDIAGLMLYSGHKNLPARSSAQGAYGGKTYRESGAKPWELTDQQKGFVTKDRGRHVLLTGLESVETAGRWNNAIQALADNTDFGIPANNSVVMSEMEPYADAVIAEFGVSKRAVLEVICGSFEPTGLLPLQMPKDMKTVEEQREDTPFDMECYVDSEGHCWDFGFG